MGKKLACLHHSLYYQEHLWPSERTSMESLTEFIMEVAWGFFCSGLHLSCHCHNFLTKFLLFICYFAIAKTKCLSSIVRSWHRTKWYTKVECSIGHALITPAPTCTIRLTLQQQQIWQHSSVMGLVGDTTATKPRTKRPKTGHPRGADSSILQSTLFVLSCQMVLIKFDWNNEV